MSNLYTFKNSILDDSTQPLDFYSPISFLSWYNQKNFTSSNLNELFDQYRKYIIAWGKKKKQTTEENNQTIRDSYIQVLRELIINYSTEEEKRFITNADLSDPSDLDIVLPFFIDKIKQVCLYYAGTRETLKTAQLQHNLRGSNYGVENLVKQLIFDAANTNQVLFANTTCNFPPISAIARQLTIYVEELYDLKDNYYNQGLPKPIKSTQTAVLSSPNNVYSRIYIDFKKAIIDAIRQYPFYITSLGINNFTVTPYLSGTETNYLKNRDFINYLSGGNDELKLNLIKRLAPKYLANDFYYLSTGTTTSNFVSGMLFSVKPLTGAPTLNLLNRQTPSVATVPSLENLYTEYEIGRFFLPQHQGLLIHNTPEKKYALNLEQLQPNTVYAFPDPAIIGNTSYNSEQDNNLVPITYTIDVSWNKRSKSNQFAFGDVISSNYNQLYYGYESREQDLQLDVSGLSKSYDNVQFWTGTTQEQWANPDIWSGLDTQEELPLEARQASLLSNDYTPVYWGSDIYNNEYGLLKRTSALRVASAANTKPGIMPNRNTVVTTGDSTADRSIAEKKYLIPGSLYFRNNITNTVLPASAALSAVFFKYPAQVKDEINNSLHYFSIYYDTFVLETASYVIVDSIIFDYNTAKITINSNPGTFIKKAKLNSKLEKFAGEWYSEQEQILYLCFLTLADRLSSSNFKLLYPKIYKTPLTNIKLSLVYPDPATNLASVYSISSTFIDPPQLDIREIEGVSFSHLDRNNLFNLTYLGKNTNSIPFFVNEQIQKNDPYYYSYEPELFKPFYFVYDNNYSNPVLQYFVRYNASSSGIMGAHIPGKLIFDVGQQDINNTTYLYCDGIKPIQINSIGKYILQFDWESYNEVNVFIGCFGYKVRNVGSNLVWNADTANAVILDKYDAPILGTKTQLFSAYTFGTSGVDTSVYVNSGYLVSPTIAGQNTFTMSLCYASSLNRAHISDSLKALNYSEPPRVIPPYSRLVAKIAKVEGVETYFIDSYTPSSYTSTLTLCGYVYPYNNPSALLSSFPVGTPVYIYNWFDEIVNFQYQNLFGTMSATVKRPVYPDPSVLEFNVFTDVPGFTGVFCDNPLAIYRPITITRAGGGNGVVISDPYCLDCGTLCTEYFGYNSTITLIASADRFSAFNRWEGSTCDMITTDCIYTVTSAAAITAYFDALPYYFVSISSPAGRTISQDLQFIINGPQTTTIPYLVGSVITLSSLKPVSGWAMFGYDGDACTGVRDTVFCTFVVNSDIAIDVLYVRYYEYDTTVTTKPLSVQYGLNGNINVTTNYPWEFYQCSSTCTYVFTGTNTDRWGGQMITISAAPYRGYKLKYWKGAPCSETESYTAPIIGLPTATVNNGPVCTFEATQNRSITGIFDRGYYTLNIIVSGDGTGRVFTTDEAINYSNTGNTNSTTYAILSGTTFTVYASALPGSTLLGVSSRFCPLTFRLSSCNITMNEDVTLLVNLSAIDFYVLTMNLSTCGVVVTAYPGGTTNSLSCQPICTATYPAGKIVNLDQVNPTASCYVKTFIGEGVYYQYARGPGITLANTTGVQFVSGDFFGLIDSSVILSPEGAPYTSGTGITITPEAFVTMTANRSVTAVLV